MDSTFITEESTIVGSYTITSTTLQWNIQQIHIPSFDPDNTNISILMLLPCLLIMTAVINSDPDAVVNSITGIMADKLDTVLVQTCIDNYNDTDTVQTVQEDLDAFTECVNVTIGSPSAFNNFWSLG